ncbi:MAG: hypothetical protein IPM29_26710 [Planctomycetes bacterium]|nr:hypothetical protein [Planctomycetota bacterium]
MSSAPPDPSRRRPTPRRALCAALLVAAAGHAQPPTVWTGGETMRLRSSTVTGSAPRFAIQARVDDDNGDRSLPTSWRRWWHFEVRGLPQPGPTTLDVRLDDVGYSDVILPVWCTSTDGGAHFDAWRRLPPSATPTVAGARHTFTVPVPAGVTDLRLAKWFPFPVARKDALLARIAGHPHVRAIRTLGTAALGRGIELVELTDASVPDAGKRRVWVHAGVHPAETTAHYTAEGLVDFLLGGAPLAERLLDLLIVDVVPMPNPDGVALGNYRTTAASVNLEEQWSAPYASTVPEIVALRTAIEGFMGTATAPGPAPIEVLLNLHASHGESYPFHYQHVANASFDLLTNRSGVIPAVNALEQRWIDALRARSPLVAAGRTLSSTLGAPQRPFVESMMHDRWTVDPAWPGPPVMAITLEGTYLRGPGGASWSTADDYLQLGVEVALALGDWVGIAPGGAVSPYGPQCAGAALSGSVTRAPAAFALVATGVPPGAAAVLALGVDRVALPLPAPSSCPLLTTPLVGVAGATSAFGFWAQSLPVPAAVTTLLVDAQLVVVDPVQAARLVTTNGAELLWW